MSVEISKKINIYWKENRSGFYVANKKEISPEPRLIGSAQSSVSKMLAQSEEQAMLMPILVGESPTSQNWQKRLATYWHSLSVPILPSGRELEIGFKYDYNTTNDIRRSHIDKLNKTEIKDSSSLSQYVEKSVNEEDKYKYGEPINIEDYMLYRYCLTYRDVANDIKDVDKSSKIRFYLFSKEQRDKLRKEAHLNKKKALAKYLEVIKDEGWVLDLLYVLGRGLSAEKMDKEEREQELYKESEQKPNEFIALAEDKNVKLKGYIERLIGASILKRLPNSSIIVDGNAPEFIVANTIEEAITFFNNEERNKAKINEFKTRYNGLKIK